jgi:hypothetical protein
MGESLQACHWIIFSDNGCLHGLPDLAQCDGVDGGNQRIQIRIIFVDRADRVTGAPRQLAGVQGIDATFLNAGFAFCKPAIGFGESLSLK